MQARACQRREVGPIDFQIGGISAASNIARIAAPKTTSAGMREEACSQFAPPRDCETMITKFANVFGR